MSVEGVLVPERQNGIPPNTCIVPPVSITPVQNVPQYGGIIFLIMGSTGAGKSAFIECLEGGNSLGISKNQLESVTHSISAYRVSDSSDNTFYLVDTPGFNDQKLSEFRIVKMIQEWMKANKLEVVSRVLYLDKITDIRVSGSRGRALNILKSLTGGHTARNIAFVTTMWDQIWNDSQGKRAEDRFQQLKNEHFKDYLLDGSQVFRFFNTQDSAIDILNLAKGNYIHDDFSFVKAVREDQQHNETPFGLTLYSNLLDRVGSTRERLKINSDELHATFLMGQAQDEIEVLIDCLRIEEEELRTELERLERDLGDFGPPPPGENELVKSQSHSRSTREKYLKQVFRRIRDTIKLTLHLRK